jgi:glycosyltransferase involved in cell wall biosynthesis
LRPLIVDLGKDFRGGQHQALLLLEGLVAHGHSPILIAVGDSHLALMAKEMGITTIGVGKRVKRIAAALHVRHLVNGKKAEVVHANEPHALSAAWLARAHRSVPVIAARRVAIPLSAGSFSMARYRAAARVIAVSEFVAQSVIASGLPAGSIGVVYDGVKVPDAISSSIREHARARFGIHQDDICIGNVAAFVPEKGHELLIRAFADLGRMLREKLPGESQRPAILHASKYVLLLRGEGPELQAMRELAGRMQIHDAVKFLPPTTEIETVFAATDIFALGSHAEPLGSALLAAMAHGLPPVAIARGGVTEVIEHERNGLLVQDLDPLVFATAMASLLTNPEKAARLGRSARGTIETRFSANQMVEATLEFYERTVRENLTGKK